MTLKSTTLNDPMKNRVLTFFVKEDVWDSFKGSNSFIKRVEYASQIKDQTGKLLKDDFKNNSSQLELIIINAQIVDETNPENTPTEPPSQNLVKQAV